jgi:exodeoxyribonuclease VII large subunit
LNKPLQVSELNNQIHSLLESTFYHIMVEGEISNLTYHNSGHIYFSIKDDKSTLSAVIFKSNASKLKFRLEVGQKVILSGNISVYVPRGSYQIICTKIEPSGIGELALAYEQLKTKLQIKGYFDKSIKKQLPQFPKKIYVITSNTGAAIEDMKKILAHRFPLAKMILLPTLVQGEGAKECIAKNIQIADNLAKDEKDVCIIVGRGGGSIEDLWAFNEEIVADSIFNACTPIISAVGHESDVVISDFVADVRASTPSNAIEIATPNINDLRVFVDGLSNEFSMKYKNILFHKHQELYSLKEMYKQQSFHKKFELAKNNIQHLKQNYNLTIKQTLQIANNQLKLLEDSYKQNHPENKLQSAYVQVTKNGKITDINQFKAGDELTLENTKYKFDCQILRKKEIS